MTATVPDELTARHMAIAMQHSLKASLVARVRVSTFNAC